MKIQHQIIQAHNNEMCLGWLLRTVVDMSTTFWWHVNNRPKCNKILTTLNLLQHKFQRSLISRVYQTMTQRKFLHFLFLLHFWIFGTGGVHYMKRKKHARKHDFLALKFGTFWAFFYMSGHATPWCWCC